MTRMIVGDPTSENSVWWVPVANNDGDFFAVEVLNIETPKPDWPWPSVEWRHLGSASVLGDEEHQVAEGFQVPTVWVSSPSDTSVWVEMEPLDSRHTFSVTGSTIDLSTEVLSEILSEQDRVVIEQGQPAKFELWAVVVHSRLRQNVVLLALAVAFENTGWDWNIVASRNEGIWLAGQGVDKSFFTSRALNELGAEGVREFPLDLEEELTEGQNLRYGFRPYETATTLPAEFIAPLVALFDSPLPLTVRDIDAIATLTEEPTAIRSLPAILTELAGFITMYGVDDEVADPIVTLSSAYDVALAIQGGSSQVFVAPRSAFFELCSVVPGMRGRELVLAFSHMVREVDAVAEFERDLFFRRLVSDFVRKELLLNQEERDLAWVGFRAKSEIGEPIMLALNFQTGRISSPIDVSTHLAQFAEKNSHQLILDWHTSSELQFAHYVTPRLGEGHNPELLFACAAYVLRALGARPQSIRTKVKRLSSNNRSD